jgi:hypothetical protein
MVDTINILGRHISSKTGSRNMKKAISNIQGVFETYLGKLCDQTVRRGRGRN